ncbi:MAG: tetratricopeptide repeat protein [Candidatus Gastranaerophilaceae bacterium]
MSEINSDSHIITSNSNTQDDAMRVADKLYKEQNYEQALKLYNDILLYTSNSDLYVKLGDCYNNTGKSATAIEYWEKAIELDSKNATAFIELGNYYFNKNQLEKAITYWISSLITVPEEPTSNLNLAIAYTFKEMPLEAFSYYEKYLKYAQDKNSHKYIEIKEKLDKNKKLANNYLKLGVQYQLRGEVNEALKAYKKAAGYCPMFSKAFLNIGALYYSDRRYAEAVTYWRKAEILDPGYSKIISNLAIAYDMLQRYDYAYCYYSRYSTYTSGKPEEFNKVSARCHQLKLLINANPHWIKKHLEKAKEYLSNCRYHEALLEFKNYIILVPDEKPLYGDLLQKIDSYIHPEAAVISQCMNQGKHFMANEDFSSAKEYFARILVLSRSGKPDYDEAKRKFAICLQNS